MAVIRSSDDQVVNKVLVDTDEPHGPWTPEKDHYVIELTDAVMPQRTIDAGPNARRKTALSVEIGDIWNGSRFVKRGETG